MSNDHDKGEFPGSTRVSLLQGAMARDEIAWEQIVSLYSPLILYWCRQDGIGTENAIEISQEVFVSISNSIPNYDPNKKGTFRGWIRTITRRRIADYFRKLYRTCEFAKGGSTAVEMIRNHPQAESEELSVEKQLLYKRAMALVKAVFREDHQEAFILTVCNGWCAKATAEKTGLSVNAVFLARYRILNRLQEEFGDFLS